MQSSVIVTLPEESSYFTPKGYSFPAICIRTGIERLESLDKAGFVLAGIDEKSLLQAVETAVQMNLDGKYGIPVPDYIGENVCIKVVKLIQSYIGIIDKWFVGNIYKNSSCNIRICRIK